MRESVVARQAGRYPRLVAGLAAGLAAGALQIAGLTTPANVVLSVLGAVIVLVEAWRMVRDLRSGRWGLDVLAISAVIATLALSEFWAAYVVTMMIVGGEALEDYAASRARRQISALLERAPQVAHLVVAGGTRDVAVADVAIGDRLMVRAGEVVPVDGTLAGDGAEFDQSSMTGESLPVPLEAGAALASGIVAMGRPVQMVATAIAADSQYQRIVTMVEEGASVRGRFIRVADRVAIPFTVLAYLLAGLAWAVSGDATRFAQVLVVATPCPLLVAAPTALVAGMGRSARAGLVVKNGETLERLASVRSAAFDKTGTLTTGKPQVVRCDVSAPDLGPDRLLALAAAAEAGSIHVLSDAIVAAAAERAAAPETVDHLHEVTGRGVEGDWLGQRVRVGRAEFASESGEFGGLPLGAGEMAVYVGVDGRPMGRVVVRDEVRANAAAVIAQLRHDGIERLIMVTGDGAENALRVAAELGIDEAHAALLPGGKVSIIADLRPRPVLMVGDGVNDAPVLAAADVGIAMGARGSSAASESAEAVLLVDDLARIPVGLAIARRTMGIARQSIFLGVGLSVALMIIATTGVVPAIIGALLQEAIDVLTILNGLRAGGSERDAPTAR